MKILVLGGGISGLSTARRLSLLCRDAEITLLEKTGRLGGRIDTVATGGFLFEKGPRTFSAARSPSLLQLISDVGLESELIFSKPSATTRYLWHRGKLKSAATLLLPHAWRLFLEPFMAKGMEDETIHSFATRRFGKKIADLFFDPITLGVYAGDCRTLSVGSCFPRLVEMERRYGSLVLAMIYRALSGFVNLDRLRLRQIGSIHSTCTECNGLAHSDRFCFVSPSPNLQNLPAHGIVPRNGKKKKFPGSLFTLKRGMQSLVDAIVEQLNIEIVLDVEIEALYQLRRKWNVETKRGSFSADAVFSALPAHSLRALLPEMPEISSSSLYLVNLGFLRKPEAMKSGYGYLVPSNQVNESLLGMIWDSEVFGGPCRMTAMVRVGASSPAEVVLDALKRHLGILELPDRMEVHIVKQAIPQLGVGQKEKLLAWERSLTDLYLSGNYMEGAAVEQCVARSEKMVKHFFQIKT